MILSIFTFSFFSCDGGLFAAHEEVVIKTYNTAPVEEIAKHTVIPPYYGCIIFKVPENVPIEAELSFELSIDINGTTYTETLSQGQVLVINNIPVGKVYPVRCTAFLPTGGAYAAGTAEAKVNYGKISNLDLVLRRVRETTSSYVEFGMWPQTIKAAGVNVDESDTKVVGMFTYYKGDDGAWYVKQRERAFGSGYKYSDGTTVKQSSANSYKYFKVEPIKWIVLTDNYNESGKKLLHSEKNLIGKRYDGDSNNYRNSEIRSWLNGSFYNTAFTDTEQNRIADTTVDNSKRSTNTDANPKQWNDGKNQNACGDTTDKIFLLSVQEVTKSEFGFAEYDVFMGDSYGTTESSRIRMPTDFAKASGVNGAHDGCSWWLRSPTYTDSGSWAYEIYYTGRLGGYDVAGDDPGNNNIAVCPALCINP